MVVKIITGSNYKEYLGEGYIEFPENHFWCDDVIRIAESFLIAGRTRNIVIITKDAMLIEALDALVEDNDGQLTFFVDDTERGKKEIDPSVLYQLYDVIGRGYHRIDEYRIRQKFE